jgi:hypothetical protein
MLPSDNPIHDCWGCQSCFAVMLEDEDYSDVTEEDLAEGEWTEYYNGFPKPFDEMGLDCE